jgi:hypothetical protein
MRDVRDNPDLEPDAVYEVDARGTVQAEWQIPANSQPQGIAGDRLLVDDYWISRDGSIARARSSTVPKPEHLPGCLIPAKLRGSEYGLCMAFVDLESGSKRRLTYDAPCT